MFTRRFLAVLALGASLVFTAACGNGGNTAKEKTDITFFGSSTLAPEKVISVYLFRIVNLGAGCH